ncbi:hypothetical protein [Gramella sp. MAR_2010_147]|uniref:hypothetical protein n=1 Tax=Gramella sp. MAR_2010_147 TaxID=1250205 RepID=UPI00087AAB8C|nr:hypothetical protein [Gramella sp. MAR_2010_147]SDR79276.1 hypothetical protein SAMN04488553_0692 [Gramella sp. MAR_2010_147]
MNTIVKRAITGGVVSTIVMGTGTFILGQISGYKAMELLQNSMSGINMLCNTVILGSTTILALMLTLLGLSRSSESRLTDRHYKDVLMIAKYDTVLIVVAVITFLMLNLPISESNEVGASWYETIYYTSLGMAALLGGGFIAVVMMLYGTITNVILIVGLNIKDHPLISKEEAEEQEQEQEQKEEEEEQKEKKEIRNSSN